MKHFKIKSYAKINLALNVIGKKNKLHKIESLISFINLHDLINDNPISCIKNFATDFFTVITIICISHYFIFPHLSIVSML